jgi:hypothetical protein
VVALRRVLVSLAAVSVAAASCCRRRTGGCSRQARGYEVDASPRDRGVLTRVACAPFGLLSGHDIVIAAGAPGLVLRRAQLIVILMGPPADGSRHGHEREPHHDLALWGRWRELTEPDRCGRVAAFPSSSRWPSLRATCSLHVPRCHLEAGLGPANDRC